MEPHRYLSLSTAAERLGVHWQSLRNRYKKDDRFIDPDIRIGVTGHTKQTVDGWSEERVVRYGIAARLLDEDGNSGPLRQWWVSDQMRQEEWWSAETRGYLSIRDIAALWQVVVTTVEMTKHRGLMPDPDVSLEISSSATVTRHRNGWAFDTIEKFSRQRGRDLDTTVLAEIEKAPLTV